MHPPSKGIRWPASTKIKVFFIHLLKDIKVHCLQKLVILIISTVK